MVTCTSSHQSKSARFYTSGCIAWSLQQRDRVVCERVLTVLRRLKPSRSGLSFPNKESTSSLARSCHSGCMPSKTIVHVSSTDVVSVPAKKNSLHSSMTSSIVMAMPDWPLLPVSLMLDSSNRPSKSSLVLSPSLIAWILFPIKSWRIVLISLLFLCIFRLFSVGKSLEMVTPKHIQYSRSKNFQ